MAQTATTPLPSATMDPTQPRPIARAPTAPGTPLPVTSPTPAVPPAPTYDPTPSSPPIASGSAYGDPVAAASTALPVAPTAPTTLPTGLSAAQTSASNDWWGSHNSDGSVREPWDGGQSRALTASDPGTDTLNRALGITPGTSANSYQGSVIEGGPRQLATDPATGLPTAAAIGKYNTAGQIAGVTGTAPSSAPPPPVASPTAGNSASTLTPPGGALPLSSGASTSASLPSIQPIPPSSAPTPTSAAGAALPVSSPATTTSGPGGIGLSNTDLTGQTISASPTADRRQLVQDEIQNYEKTLNPQFNADVRSTIQNAAGLGRIGSGDLRTSVGNLALARDNALSSRFSDLTNNAAAGSIGDAQEAARLATQQQGFQAGEQNTAFNQSAQQAQLQEALTNGDFNRYMQILNAGSTGNPSDTALALSNSYGNQATGAGNALAGLIGNSVGAANSSLPPWLQALLTGGQGAPSSRPLPVGGDGGGVS